MTFSSDTIAAVATPPGIGGIGVLRVSGENAFQVVSPFFFQKRDAQKAVDLEKELKARQVVHGYIKDPIHAKIVDEVLLIKMPAPNSYTCENIVEIQAHGSSMGLYGILELLLSNGCRLAEAGEFTKRAFLNGRIDLSQAEAVQELISAQTMESAALASSQMVGVLSDQIRSLRQTLLSLCAKMEAEIDFPEDVAEKEETDSHILQAVERKIQELLTAYEEAKSWRQEFQIALVGAPNVGKSSLLNALLKTQKAIVTDIPGTTRDAIEGNIWMQGTPMTIVDTAGIRTTKDVIEGLGIAKTMDVIEKSDLVLFVTDVDPVKEKTKEIHDLFSKTMKEKFWVQNKSDLLESSSIKKTSASFLISAKTGEGLSQLQKKIAAIREKRFSTVRPSMAPGLRHKALLEDANERFKAARHQLQENIPRDVVLLDLRLGMESIDRILGLSYDADLLNEIFSQFCIGK